MEADDDQNLPGQVYKLFQNKIKIMPMRKQRSEPGGGWFNSRGFILSNGLILVGFFLCCRLKKKREMKKAKSTKRKTLKRVRGRMKRERRRLSTKRPRLMRRKVKRMRTQRRKARRMVRREAKRKKKV